jgi:purine-cytosine permease-like protein
MAIIILAFGVFGHPTIVACEKFTAVASLICFALLVYFAAVHWHPSPAAPTRSAGGFWPTWVLAVTTQIANAISYAPFAGDYGRYMPGNSKPRPLIGWSFFGMVAGCILALTRGEVIGLAFGYIGLVQFNLADSIVALCSVVTVLFTPWTMINISGYLQHRGQFDVGDLQAFARGDRRHWYTSGANLGAIVAWAVGVVIGSLFSGTSLFTGPLAHIANGVDLSFISSAVVATVLYRVFGRTSAARGPLMAK